WVNLIKGLVVKAKVISEELMVNKKMQNVKALQISSIALNDQDVPLPENMGSDIPIMEHFLPSELITFLENLENAEITISLKDEQTVVFESSSKVEVPLKDLPNGWRLVDVKPDFI